MERKKRGERRGERVEKGEWERWGEYERERNGEWVGERKRETVKDRGEWERERKTDVPKLYAYNECEHSVSVVFTLHLGYFFVLWGKIIWIFEGFDDKNQI